MWQDSEGERQNANLQSTARPNPRLIHGSNWVWWKVCTGVGKTIFRLRGGKTHLGKTTATAFKMKASRAGNHRHSLTTSLSVFLNDHMQACPSGISQIASMSCEFRFLDLWFLVWKPIWSFINLFLNNFTFNTVGYFRPTRCQEICFRAKENSSPITGLVKYRHALPKHRFEKLQTVPNDF